MVRSCVRVSFSSLWALTVHINALYIMKVYSDRNNIQVELIHYVTNIDFSPDGKFQGGQQFMTSGSLLYRSVKSQPCTAVEQEISFPSNKQRRQLWDSTVNRHRWI